MKFLDEGVEEFDFIEEGVVVCYWRIDKFFFL